MFTIIYFRTLYVVTTEPFISPFLITLDNSAVSSPPTAKLKDTQDGKELSVSQIPLSSTITDDTRYLTKDVIAQLKEQIKLILQVAHLKQADSFTLKVSGLFCWRPVASLLQMVLREQKGVFRTIMFQCPTDEVKNMYQDIFGVVCD